jgi:thymidylate synthase ThyX
MSEEYEDITSAKVVADSLGPNGVRLTTIEATYPLIVHNELMTHRMLSRNTASNRAIPVARMLESVQHTPFIPRRWPRNTRGMQESGWLDDEAEITAARREWLRARDAAIVHADGLMQLGVHKQITNRLLGPFLYTTAVVSATEWANFFALRVHPMAQPEMRLLAERMYEAYSASRPRRLAAGQWHTPYVDELADGAFDEIILDNDAERAQHVRWCCLVSVGRCAGVSYLRQGDAKDAADAFALAVRLSENRPGHWSPFEHVAQAQPPGVLGWSGNFRGWKQLRKMYADENIDTFERAES